MKARLLVVALLLAGCTTAATTTTVSPATTTTPEPTTTADPCPGEICVRLVIDPSAVWSDGTPVTAADFVHTFETVGGGPAFDPVYTAVDSVEAPGEKEVLVVLSRRVPVPRLFSVVLPAHDPAATSGPLVPAGDGRYEAGGVTVEVVPADGVRGVIQAIRRGEADMGWLPDPPDWALLELGQIDGVGVAATPGRDWEMVVFNQANPLLAEDWMRRAIAMALDRESLAGLTVRTVHPGARVLDSSVWMEGSGVSVPAYPHRHDPDGARELLREHGCVAGPDGIHVCGGTRASLTWMTTAGDPWREAIAARAEQDLEAAGIDLEASLFPPEEMFGEERLFGTGWDIAQFAWEAQADPTASVELYRCAGALNVGGHCSDVVDGAVADLEAGAGDPRSLLDRIDREFVDAVAIVPLFQRPVVWAVTGSEPVTAPGPFTGPFEVAVDLGRDVRVALARLPGDPVTTAALDPLTDSLRRSLFRGAFRATGDGGYAPDLVVDYEVFGG